MKLAEARATLERGRGLKTLQDYQLPHRVATQYVDDLIRIGLLPKRGDSVKNGLDTSKTQALEFISSLNQATYQDQYYYNPKQRSGGEE